MYTYIQNNPVMNVIKVAKMDNSNFINSTSFNNMTIPDEFEPFNIFYEYIFVFDISVNIIFIKVGVSAVVDFKEKHVELYGHAGLSSIKFGVSPSVGIVTNYEQAKDYKGWFYYGEAGLFVGIGRSSNRFLGYDNLVTCTYVSLSLPHFTAGGDYYYTNESLYFEWGD